MTQIESYRVTCTYAQGPSGTTYGVVDGDGQELVLEAVAGTHGLGDRFPGPDGAARMSDHLRSELRALPNLHHTNLPDHHDVGFSPSLGLAYVVRDRVESPYLAEFFEAQPEPAAIQDVFLQLARVIDQLHAVGLVHGQIRASSIRVAEEEGRPCPKVLDVGVAQLTRFALIEPTDSTSGLPVPDHRIDVYGLADATVEALLGRKRGVDDDTISWQQQARELEPRIGPVLAGLLARMLEPDTTKRPPTLRAVVLELLRRSPTQSGTGTDAAEDRKQLAALLLERVPFVDGGGHLGDLLELADELLVADDRRTLMRTIVVHGAPGLGKRTLAAEFRRGLQMRGLPMWTVAGGGDNQGLTAFGPTVLQIASGLPEEDLAAHESLVQEARSRLPAATDPSRLVEFFIAAAKARPYVLHLSEFGRTPDASRQLLDQLTRAIVHYDAPMLTLVTATPSPRLTRVIDRLRQEDLAELRTLRPLEAFAIRKLLRGLFGDSPVVEPLVARLRELAAGHPLAIRETLRLLMEEGVLDREGTDWMLHGSKVDAAGLHDALAQHTAERIDRIGVAAWEVVASLHLVDEPISRSDLGGLVELRKDRFDRVLERLEGEGVIIVASDGEGSEIGLAHRAAHEAVESRYESSLDETRIDLAERITELGTDDPRMAYLCGRLLDEAATGLEHIDRVRLLALQLCERGQPALGAALLDRIIHRRRERGGLDGAPTILESILDLLRTAPGALEDPGEEMAHYHAGVLLAQLLASHRSEATLLLGLADRFVNTRGDDQDHVLRLLGRAARAASRAHDQTLELRILSRRAELLCGYGRIEEADRDSEAAMALLEIEGRSDSDAVKVMGVRIRTLTFAGRFDEARALHVEAKPVAARIPVVQRQSYLSGTATLGSSTDPTPFIEEHQQAVTELREIGSARALRTPLHNLGDLQLRAGHFALAVEAFEEALALGTLMGSEFDINLNRGYLGYAMARNGDVDTGGRLVAAARDGMYAEVGEHFGYHQMRVLDAEIQHMQGHTVLARQALEELIAELEASQWSGLASWARVALERIESEA